MHCVVFVFLQEVLARGVLLPLINQLSDPDYINQFVIWMVRVDTCAYVLPIREYPKLSQSQPRNQIKLLVFYFLNRSGTPAVTMKPL